MFFKYDNNAWKKKRYYQSTNYFSFNFLEFLYLINKIKSIKKNEL